MSFRATLEDGVPRVVNFNFKDSSADNLTNSLILFRNSEPKES